MNSDSHDNSYSSYVGKEIRLEIHATFEALRTIDEPIDAFLKHADAFDDSAIYNVKLAVHEICTNIVEHAYELDPYARLDLWLELIERPAVRLVVKIRDSGLPFTGVLEGHEEPSAHLDDHGDGGYGLFLAHMLMDSIEYRRVGEYNLWRLEIQPSPLGNDSLLHRGNLTDEHSR